MHASRGKILVTGFALVKYRHVRRKEVESSAVLGIELRVADPMILRAGMAGGPGWRGGKWEMWSMMMQSA